MYFKITKVGEQKYTDMGMINVCAAFYLEPGDAGYDKYVAEHFVTIPIIPKDGYTGKIDKETGKPDVTEYNNWLATLPTTQRFNPFCNHFMQFEPTVTEEEILYCFEWALPMTQANYIKDDLKCNVDGVTVNQPINYDSRKAYYEGIKIIPDINKTPKMIADAKLVSDATAKIAALKDIDFSKIKTVAEYKVK